MTKKDLVIGVLGALGVGAILIGTGLIGVQKHIEAKAITNKERAQLSQIRVI